MTNPFGEARLRVIAAGGLWGRDALRVNAILGIISVFFLALFLFVTRVLPAPAAMLSVDVAARDLSLASTLLQFWVLVGAFLTAVLLVGEEIEEGSDALVRMLPISPAGLLRRRFGVVTGTLVLQGLFLAGAMSIGARFAAMDLARDWWAGYLPFGFAASPGGLPLVILMVGWGMCSGLQARRGLLPAIALGVAALGAHVAFLSPAIHSTMSTDANGAPWRAVLLSGVNIGLAVASLVLARRLWAGAGRPTVANDPEEASNLSSSLVLAARRLLGSGPGPAVSVLLPPLALVLLLRVVIPAIIGDGSWRNAVPERFRMPEVFACILMGQALLPRVLRDQGSCVLYTLPASPLRLHAFHLSALAVVAPGVVGILHAVFVARYPAVGVACAFGAVAACLGYLGRLFVRSQLLCFAGCSAVMLGWWGAASGLALASHIGMWPEVWAGTPLQDHAWPACVAAMLTALLAVVALNGSTLLELSDTRRRRAFAIVCACLLVGGTSLMLLTPHDVAILLARGGN